ncbi:hypothetical protein VT84_33115 [Gemmata sp. SH-PL17]|uniref:hypothetical protein n=1 Tax=Gemmata sp. SH-PL17 TaxID=1630693 RepID=UPI00078EF591|nr:hypothetical protein [Gemmata sp. SH-PL17]AMV29283.1 hypothetical protein VT84_33115 [Gemmata sp. SH-PL17]
MGRVAHYKKRTADRKAAGVPMIGPDPRPTGLQRVALPVLRAECPHQKDLQRECSTCAGPNEARRTYYCDHPDNEEGICTRGNTQSGLWTCATCDHHPDAPRAKVPQSFHRIFPAPVPPPCGIVVGVYKWAALAEVQIRAVRESCGPVPVLISNDDPRIHADLERICAKYPGAELSTNPERIGHGGGDIAAFHKGALWGRERGLEYVCKLSQRFIPTAPFWLQDGAKALDLADLATATRKCDHPRWPVRTEIVLMRVKEWTTPAALEFYKPRPFYFERAAGYDAETLIAELIREHLGGAYWPWELVPMAREQSGAFLWHHSSTVDEYRAFAARFGVALPDDFTCEGWERDFHAGLYKHG